jgi:hypothetical protein
LIILFFELLSQEFYIRSVFAQDDPAEQFDILCADCHSIGEGDMQGPDLLGVEQKYSNEWLINFIQSANMMVENGDLQAIAIYEEFDNGNMPDTDLPISEIQALIDYIKGFNKSIEQEDSKASISPDIGENQNLETTIRSEVMETLKEKQYEDRLEVIENKIDMILEFHKKSLSARITDEEIRKGQALFEGEIPFTDNVPACVECHNNYKIDTLNWNPSAYDIATTYSKRSDIDMINLIINPVSDKMKDVLKDHKLTDDESFYITAYLQNVAQSGLKEHKKLPVDFILFISLCLIFAISIFDFHFTKIIKIKFVYIILCLVPGIFIVKILYGNATNIGINKNYAPDQPIKFSHRIHVKENSIECLFCHNSPEFSRESGVPTTNVCMICHNKIKTGVMTGQFEINKIIKSFEENKPIEWIKIHNLPDHVFFSHAQHVNIGKIGCETCHGDIQEMHITKQYASLSMGWCVQCHRESEVQFEENKFYSKHIELHEDLKSGKIKKVTADKIGANDCQKCHY